MSVSFLWRLSEQIHSQLSEMINDSDSPFSFFGDWIMKIISGHSEFFTFTEYSDKCSSDGYRKEFIEAREKGYLEIVDLLLSCVEISSKQNGGCLELAIINNHLDVVKLLVRDGRVDISSGLEISRGEIREYLWFELCKVKLFLCGEICRDYLIVDLANKINWIFWNDGLSLNNK